MQKIEWLFQKDEKWKAIDNISPNMEWVFNGDSIATVKWDGACCAIINDRFYKRHKLNEGKSKPFMWIHHTLNPEQKTGHGWKPVTENSEDQYFAEGLKNTTILLSEYKNRTFELLGHKVNKCRKHYPEIFATRKHILKQHGMDHIKLPDNFGYNEIKLYLVDNYIEGIVFHRISEKGYAKVCRRHFGLSW